MRTHAHATMTTAALDAAPAAVAHVRYAGRSLDVPLAALDVGLGTSDGHVRRAVAAYLGVAESVLLGHVVDRHANGNLTVRPEAVFG